MAIAMDPSNSKAYHRRYKAKIGLKDYMVSNDTAFVADPRHICSGDVDRCLVCRTPA
jgi:hypothetical protein